MLLMEQPGNFKGQFKGHFLALISMKVCDEYPEWHDLCEMVYKAYVWFLVSDDICPKMSSLFISRYYKNALQFDQGWWCAQ